MAIVVAELALIVLMGLSWLANSLSLKQLINLRLENLRKFASTPQYPVQKCSSDKFLIITGGPYGSSGNRLIEFTHAVWLARKMNATLIVPDWMDDIFAPFDSSTLKKNFCFTLDKDTAVSEGITPTEVTSSDAFFLSHLFHEKKFISFLPSMSEAVDDLSVHFLKVYAALWSSPLPEIRAAGEWLMKNHLGNSLVYTSVHKRNLDGECSNILAHVSSPSDYAPDEIPADIPEWKGSLEKDHPLCSMPLHMVLAIQELRHRTNSSLFVAFDGQGDVENYLKYGAVFSNLLDKVEGQHSKHRKFVDMFMAMHSDLFILNPRSTFSWQVYLIRVCLALESVPIINNDFYMERIPEQLVKANRTMWVSWTSVVDEYVEGT
jgi:hypothetical protein